MRKLFALSLFTVFMICVSGISWAQMVPPANWSHSVNKTSINTGDEIIVTFKTDIPEGYHIYSNDFSDDCPPQKAAFTFDEHASYKLVGGAKPFGTHKYIDDIFECEVSDFEGKAEFRQTIQVLSPDPVIVGLLEYQMCTADGMCVLFEYEFKVDNITVSGASKAVEPIPTIDDDQIKVVSSPTEEIVSKFDTSAIGNIDPKLLEQLLACCDKDNDVPTTKYAGLVSADSVNYSEYQGTGEGQVGVCIEKTHDADKGENAISYWAFFLIAFGAGLVALLTPCVFPMIPMTVSFFMKDGSRAKAIKSGLIYAASIIVIYVIFGTLFSLLTGPAGANFLATHWAPNVFFFLIFVVFAASFFGAFELVLPSSWVNKMDKKADQGGLTGIFFMAFTIVLVSFSCTGPIVGSVLVEAAKGAFIKPMIGMFGFSLAFAIPFGLFAIFPSWLNNLPQSGGWLNSVKVVLGFVELAFGLKFLSVADQTYHWGILDREIYIALWIVIFTLMGIYLLGKIAFSHDSPVPFLKFPRLVFAILTFSFVVYLIPGMWGAPLKALAGYMPPMSTHDFNILSPHQEGKSKLCETPKYKENLHLPHGIEGYFDYEQGMECARKQGKPVFIDFTGHGCVNCREMEAVVWSDPKVLQLLKEEYIVISLYVDDKTIELPMDEQYYSKSSGKLITNLAKKNSDIEQCLFNKNSQPLYALMDNEAELLQPKTSYNLDISQYVSFLEKGLKEYQKRMDQKLESK